MVYTCMQSYKVLRIILRQIIDILAESSIWPLFLSVCNGLFWTLDGSL